MVQMIGGGSYGQRKRYLAEQEILMEELFAKAEGFTTPITKPVASFKAPAVGGAPKAAAPKAALKPTGGKLPTSADRLAQLKQGLADKIGQTAPSTGAPAAVGTVGKADKLRRKGKFQRTKPSTVTKGFRSAVGGSLVGMTAGAATGAKAAGPLARRVEARALRAGKTVDQAEARRIGVQTAGAVLLTGPGGVAGARTGARLNRRFAKREPLKTHVSDDDARKLVDRYNLKGPLPKNLSREQKMAAYEARYVSAGGKKAEKWDRRARRADQVKTGGLGVATAGGAAWLATRGKTKAKISPRVREVADNIAVGGAVAGGAGELYAGYSRRKRSSYASAPAGVAASALRRMRDYTP